LNKLGVPARSLRRNANELQASAERHFTPNPVGGAAASPRRFRRHGNAALPTSRWQKRTTLLALSRRTGRCWSTATFFEVLADCHQTHRARGRAAPGVAGGDDSRDVQYCQSGRTAPARPEGQLHVVTFWL